MHERMPSERIRDGIEAFNRGDHEAVLEFVTDVVLVRGVFHATGAGSGIEIDTEAFTVYKVTPEGLAWRIENWRTREDAERSSGLRFS